MLSRYLKQLLKRPEFSDINTDSDMSKKTRANSNSSKQNSNSEGSSQGPFKALSGSKEAAGSDNADSANNSENKSVFGGKKNSRNNNKNRNKLTYGPYKKNFEPFEVFAGEIKKEEEDDKMSHIDRYQFKSEALFYEVSMYLSLFFLK